MINPPCERRWLAGACLTDDLPPQPVAEPHECRQPAGHPPPCRCYWCGTTREETTMPEPTTTLHALAEECEAHAQAWDQRDDPDGHAAAWDALHTLLTAAGASVEHLADRRPDLAPAAVDDIVTAVRQLATHLTVAEEADDA